MTSTSDTDSCTAVEPVQILTPPPSPPLVEDYTTTTTTVPSTSAAAKKKKKKKAKKSNKAKDAATSPAPPPTPTPTAEENQPPPLYISRNKHWKYISSFHGPWLQLPLELLESLLVLNMDPGMLSAPDVPHSPPPQRELRGLPPPKSRDRGFASLSDHTPPDSPRMTFTSFSQNTNANPFPSPAPGKASPPPVDPGVFRSVALIRRLIDEASELSVRASSGLSAVALGSLRNGSGGLANSPWGSTQGFNPLGDNGHGGRNVTMSATRIHRLRALAVQKLSAAYAADEIASSVMVMQGGSVFDDIAERVLKYDPNDADAKYVHFFHEKIPSRQLAESTNTDVLDNLIAQYPHRLEYLRTRGIVHCFRDEYGMATKDFTHALREARARRKAKSLHNSAGSVAHEPSRCKGGKKKKGKSESGKQDCVGSDLPSNFDGSEGDQLILHPSVLSDAPEPIEPQCLFFRGTAYLQHAIFLIEAAMLELEGVRKSTTPDGTDLRLCYVEGGRFGGTEIGNPDGPLGRTDGPKLAAYREVLADATFKETILTLVKKSFRDHEKFLSHFDTVEGSPYPGLVEGDLVQRTEYAFLLFESLKSGHHSQKSSPPRNFVIPEVPASITTYHPLLVEAYFSRLLCLLIMGDFTTLLPTFSRTTMIVDGLEGYPVFLPPRSMAQAEFAEILERLASGWTVGLQPNSCSRKRLMPSGSSKSNGKDREVEPETAGVADEYPQPLPSFSISDYSPSASSVGNWTGASSSRVPSPALTSTTNGTSHMPDNVVLMQSLDHLRILLQPVAKRQKERVEVEQEEATAGRKKKGLSISIPLHGPRVEIILAWLAAVHLAELEKVAV